MNGQIGKLVGIALLLALAAALPFLVGNIYHIRIAALIGIYWILIAGLNLVIGYTGQISIGHVGLLALGAYTFAIMTGGPGVNPWAAMACAALLCGIAGAILGLPSLRLPGFYFAMTTLAFALIAHELAVAWEPLTGGGIGLMVPGFPGVFAGPAGFYWLVAGLAALVSLCCWCLTRSSWGRAMIAVRDSEVAAQAAGIPIYRLKLYVFGLSGVLAGLSGALFATYQTYITPETFVFELSMFFFVCIVVGGRGSMIGPFIGTVFLALLPELVAPLARLGNFFYGLLLLAVVLLVPEGIAQIVQIIRDRFRSAGKHSPGIRPAPDVLRAALDRETGKW